MDRQLSNWYKPNISKLQLLVQPYMSSGGCNLARSFLLGCSIFPVCRVLRDKGWLMFIACLILLPFSLHTYVTKCSINEKHHNVTSHISHVTLVWMNNFLSLIQMNTSKEIFWGGLGAIYLGSSQLIATVNNSIPYSTEITQCWIYNYRVHMFKKGWKFWLNSLKYWSGNCHTCRTNSDTSDVVYM